MSEGIRLEFLHAGELVGERTWPQVPRIGEVVSLEGWGSHRVEDVWWVEVGRLRKVEILLSEEEAG